MYTIAIAGSTERTQQVAATLATDSRFQLSLIVTPAPRKIGRKQLLTENPLHQFAHQQSIDTVLVGKKIDQTIQEQIETSFNQQPFDFFLVVDFGFLVPSWLLQLPKIAPLNIHPSLLPAWRGASPGQYVLLNGDQDSAVTLMVMNEALDEGPIITQLPFTVEPTWTQTEYYQHSFDLICDQLGNLIDQFAKGELTAQEQPKDSPTPLADRLTKQEAFRPWEDIKQAMENGANAPTIERAIRAYYPWPKLWTKVPTNQGEKRLIIHRSHLDTHGQLVLDQVQLAGQQPATWNQIKTAITD